MDCKFKALANRFKAARARIWNAFGGATHTALTVDELEDEECTNRGGTLVDMPCLGESFLIFSFLWFPNGEASVCDETVVLTQSDSRSLHYLRHSGCSNPMCSSGLLLFPILRIPASINRIPLLSLQSIILNLRLMPSILYRNFS